MQVTHFIQSRLSRKIVAYGFFLSAVLLLAMSPLLGFDIAEASSGGCDLGPGFNLGTCIGSGVAWLVAGFNSILALGLYLIGLILDFAIQFSITPGNLYRSDTINVAWTLLRDIINMAFIFLLLYVAIGTVLNIQSVNWKKQVAQIVIAAILVNFSLFITRVVIDAGNILAHSFYQEITTCADGTCGDRGSVGISERFMNALGIAAITNLEAADSRALDGWRGVANGLMSTVTIVVAGAVFFMSAILFITRTFALVFILVLSPIGVAGAGLPLLSPHAKRWREELFKQAMLGAVFLFFMFVILMFAHNERGVVGATGLGATGDGAELISNALGTTRNESGVVEGPESLFMMYVFVIAGLIMALRLTKSLSGQVGQAIETAFKTAAGVAIGVAAPAAAFAGRQTLGRAATRHLGTDAGKALKERAAGGDRNALWQLNQYERLSKSSFDGRTTRLGKAITSNLGGVGPLTATLGVEQGKGGRKKRIDDAAKARAKDFESLSPEGQRVWADKLEEGTKTRIPGVGRGVNKEAAKQLRKSALQKERGKEGATERAEKAVLELEGLLSGRIQPGKDKDGKDRTVEQEIADRIGKLGKQGFSMLSEDALTNETVLKSLEVGDMRGLRDSVDRSTLAKIVKSDHLNDRVKNYVDNPDSGFPETGRAFVPENKYGGPSAKEIQEATQRGAAEGMLAAWRAVGKQGGSPNPSAGYSNSEYYVSEKGPLLGPDGRPLKRDSFRSANTGPTQGQSTGTSNAAGGSPYNPASANQNTKPGGSTTGGSPYNPTNQGAGAQSKEGGQGGEDNT